MRRIRLRKLPQPLSLAVTCLLVQSFYESTLIQFADEACVNKLLRLVIADFWSGLRDKLVNSLKSFGDRIRSGDEILSKDRVRTFQKFRIGGFYVFAQNLQAELF